MGIPGAIIGAAVIGGGLSYLGAKKASKSQEQAAQAQLDAQLKAQELITQSNEEAAGLIAEGNEAAAAATIEAAKIAAKAMLESTQMSIAAQKEFFAKANATLQPTIKQGRFAADEIASMLSIPNSQGQLVPFDISKLTELPSFQTAMAGVERTAIGKKLSTQTAEQAALRGADFFGQRVSQLYPLAQFGANAENQLAQTAGQVGGGIGNTIMAGGAAQANIASQQGANLASIYQQGAAQQAGLSSNQANALANIALASGQTKASLYANQGNIASNMYNNISNIAQGALGNYVLLNALGGLGSGGASTPVSYPVTFGPGANYGNYGTQLIRPI